LGDYEAITKVVQHYLDGAKSGKGSDMKPAFHKDATIFGYVGPDLFAGPIQGLYDWNDKNGPATGIKSRISEIDIVGTIANVRGCDVTELARAQRLMEEARRGLEAQAGPGIVATMDFELGWVELAKGETDSADRLFRQSLDDKADFRGGHMAASVEAALALTAALRGDVAGSRAMAESAVQTARAMRLPEVLVMALTRVSESAVVVGDHDWARRSLTEALQVLRDVRGRAWVALSLELAAIVCSADEKGSAVPIRLLAGGA